MAQLFNILKITVGKDALDARVLVNPGVPLRTSEDIEATARVYYLAPAIAKHLCLGDAGREFQECMGDTELAHLLEHLTVEIMNETGLAGRVSCGRTRQVPGDERLFDVELSCPDDALTVGALSSATFMMDWAFLHADAPAPDFPGTVAALRKLVLNLRGEDDEPAGEDGAPVDVAVSAAPAPSQDAPSAAPDAAPRRIDTECIRPHYKAGRVGNPPAKRVADVKPVYGGAAGEARAAAPARDAADPDATVTMRPVE